MLKKAEVLEVGSNVIHVKTGDIIEVYVNTMVMISKDEGFCSERDVIFTNSLPPEGKVHIKNPSKKPLSPLTEAEVVNSNAKEIEKGDVVYFKSGQSHILPDNSEIISETQIYHK